MAPLSRRVAGIVAAVWVALAPTSRLALSAEEPSATPPEVERLTQAAIDLLTQRAIRLERVSGRIRINAAHLCPIRAPVLGVVFFTTDDISHNKPGSKLLFARSDAARVLGVVEELPAGRAGLRPGDLILRMDGSRVGDAEDVRDQRIDPAKGSFEIEYERGGTRHIAAVEHVPGCEHAPSLYLSDLIDAGASHHRVIVTTAMMRFIQSDHELAVIVGHELAHNMLKHSYSQPRWEEEADYVGSYFSALGGYDPGHGVTFWRRFARRHVAGSVYRSGRSHPTYPARLEALAAAMREIRGKLDRAQPLTPEYQK